MKEIGSITTYNRFEALEDKGLCYMIILHVIS